MHREWSYAGNWRVYNEIVRPHSRVYEDNEISRGFKSIRLLAFLRSLLLAEFFPCARHKVDLFLVLAWKPHRVLYESENTRRAENG